MKWKTKFVGIAASPYNIGKMSSVRVVNLQK